MLLLNQHAARDDLRVDKHLVDALHFGASDINGIQRRQAFADSARGHPAAHHGQDLEAMLVTSSGVVNASVG
jgi:hypothetical protein